MARISLSHTLPHDHLYGHTATGQFALGREVQSRHQGHQPGHQRQRRQDPAPLAQDADQAHYQEDEQVAHDEGDPVGAGQGVGQGLD